VGGEDLPAPNLHFRQKIFKSGDLLVNAEVVIVCVREGFKPKRLPSSTREALS
jgi:acyl-CoA thioesterase FadM